MRNPIQAAIDAVRGRRQVARQEESGRIFVNPLCSNYENAWAPIRALVNEMKMVRPYGVGVQGGALPASRTPELAALYSPNEKMGWAEFIDDVFVTWLTESEVNIHVWRRGNGRVYGYSRLPVGSRLAGTFPDGLYHFQTQFANGVIETLTSDEVMTLRFSRSPQNIDLGVSPGTAVQEWAQIDDLRGQFLKAYFENGAVPASVTTIRASSYEKFKETRKDLEDNLHGARNKNKTLYLWKQFNNQTGEEIEQVEVKPIQATNSTMALKEITDIINDKLNKSVGVSEFILGNDSSAKYDNAELSQQQFLKARVYPALVAFWDQFQHELDRITGGLGYGIQFDLEIPELTEQAKTKSEIARIKAETARIRTEQGKLEIESSRANLDAIIAAVSAGASAESAAQAFGDSDNWLEIARGVEARTLATSTVSSPLDSSSSTANVTSHSLTDGHTHSSTVASVTTDAYEPVFTSEETAEKTIYDQLMRIVDAIAEKNPEIPYEEVKQIVFDVLKEQADGGANLGAGIISGQVENAISEEIDEVLADGGYQISNEMASRMQERTSLLVDRFGEDMQEAVNNILTATPSLTAAEIKKELRANGVDSRRAETIARNEVVHSVRAGRLANDEVIAKKYGLKIEKVWKCRHDKDTCDLCEAMDGEVVSLTDAFPEKEVTLESGRKQSWDRDTWNLDGEIPQAHVNCRCYFNERVVAE